jgi:peptidyl-prolyl cis-trans isomerase SurA
MDSKLAEIGIGRGGLVRFYRSITRLRKRWRLIFVSLITASIMAVACPLYGKQIVDRIVAIVNNEVISLYELNQRIEPIIDEIKKTTATLSEQGALIRKVETEHLDLLIDEKLADQEIRRLKIRVAERQVDEALDRFRSSNKITIEELETALADQGRSLKDFRKEISAQILRARLVNREINSKVIITNDEVVAYYKTHLEQFGAESAYRLRNIVMTDSAVQGVGKKPDATSVYEKLMAGESFDVLAREYSEAPNAVDGGALGTISAKMLAPEIRKAIEFLKPGEFTEIIETDQGAQIFYLEAIDAATAEPFEKVKARIEDTLYKQIVDEKYEGWLGDLRARSHIKLIR